MPTISIIVPVYNVEKYLARCLDSILNQTFTDFEIICVNDGSKDASLAILKQYAQKDTRIVVINQDNQGQSVARNNGLELAQGEYILFVDSDDAIEKQLLEIAYGFIITHEAVMVCWDYDRSDGLELPSATFDIQSLHIKVTDDILPYYEKTINKKYTLRHSVCDKLYRKSLIASLSFPEGMYFEDVVYSWQIMLLCPKVIIIAAPLYLYTLNQCSTMQQSIPIKHIRDYQKITNLVYSMVNTPNTQEACTVFKDRAIASFLRIQSIRISKRTLSEQLPFWLAFEEQLRDFDAKGMMPNDSNKPAEYQRICHYILKYGAHAYYERELLYWYTKPFHIKRTDRTKAYYIRGIKIFSKEKLDLKKRRVFICGITISYTCRK